MTRPTSACHTGQHLSATDLAVLSVLLEHRGKVIGRETILRRSGLDSSSTRRPDTSIVVLRKILGTDSILTVRSRGWMLTLEGAKLTSTLMPRSD